jgi:hypothetical protein
VRVRREHFNFLCVRRCSSAVLAADITGLKSGKLTARALFRLSCRVPGPRSARCSDTRAGQLRHDFIVQGKGQQEPATCQGFVRKETPFRSFYTAEVLDYEWRVRQDLNLQPSDPKSEALSN